MILKSQGKLFVGCCRFEALTKVFGFQIQSVVGHFIMSSACGGVSGVDIGEI